MPSVSSLVPKKHLRCLGFRLVASAAEERDKACVVGDGRCIWRWTGLGREEGGEGREGSEKGGAWVGTGLGREDGGERDGRRMGGDGAGEGRSSCGYVRHI